MTNTDPTTDDYLTTMVTAYITSALWSSTDNADESGGEPLDTNYGPDDVEDDTVTRMTEDCRDFVTACRADLEGMDPGQAGHDFWLTRNGHGAGFWDRGLGERGDRLTAMAKPYGEFTLYVTDSNTISGE